MDRLEVLLNSNQFVGEESIYSYIAAHKQNILSVQS
jgi:hypothetical protein